MNEALLLIDDDPDDRELFCEALQHAAPEFLCYTASNCRKATAILDNRELVLPRLIFLDINMPTVNGWQCLSILKQKEPYRSIPVVLYSTSSYPEHNKMVQQEGALCFFSKPCSYNELKSILEVVVFHLNANTLPLLAKSPPFSPVPSFME